MSITNLPYDPRMRERVQELRHKMTPMEKKLWYSFLRTYPRQRIIAVTEVIDKTPPRASAQKIPADGEITNIEITPSEIAAAEATSIEDLNLESTIEHIDKILLDMATEEATTAAKEAMAAVPRKEKEIADEANEASKDEAFML